MENEIVRFLARYGIWGVIGVVLAIVITDLIKSPYKKWAEKMAPMMTGSTNSHLV